MEDFPTAMLDYDWLARGWSPTLARGLANDLLRSTQVTTVVGMGWWLKKMKPTTS